MLNTNQGGCGACDWIRELSKCCFSPEGVAHHVSAVEGVQRDAGGQEVAGEDAVPVLEQDLTLQTETEI